MYWPRRRADLTAAVGTKPGGLCAASGESPDTPTLGRKRAGTRTIYRMVGRTSRWEPAPRGGPAAAGNGRSRSARPSTPTAPRGTPDAGHANLRSMGDPRWGIGGGSHSRGGVLTTMRAQLPEPSRQCSSPRRVTERPAPSHNGQLALNGDPSCLFRGKLSLHGGSPLELGVELAFHCCTTLPFGVKLTFPGHAMCSLDLALTLRDHTLSSLGVRRVERCSALRARPLCFQHESLRHGKPPGGGLVATLSGGIATGD